MREPAISVDCAVWGRQEITAGKRSVPEETAVALSYDGGTYAVTIASSGLDPVVRAALEQIAGAKILKTGELKAHT